MNRSIHRISLDIHKVGSQTVLNVKKGDTARSICITLTENGRPYEIVENCSAVFNAKKPDGNYILNDCVIQGNEIVYDFTPQTAPVAGAMECEVSLYDKAGNQITSPRFLIVVDEVVYNGEEIVSTSEANVLKEMIEEAAEVTTQAEEAVVRATKATEGAESSAELASNAADRANESAISASKAAETANEAVATAIPVVNTAEEAAMSATKAARIADEAATSANKAAAEATEATLLAREIIKGETNFLDSDHITKWNIVRQSDNPDTPADTPYNHYAGAVDMTEQGIEGVTGMLAQLQTNSFTTQWTDFVYDGTVDLGTNFSMLITAFINNYDTHPKTPYDDSYVEIQFGMFSIRLVRKLSDMETGYDFHKLRLALCGMGNPITYTDIITSKEDFYVDGKQWYDYDTYPTTTLYDGQPATNSPLGQPDSSVLDYIRSKCPAQNGHTLGVEGARAFTRNHGWKDFTIKLKNGVLSVIDANGNPFKFMNYADGTFSAEEINLFDFNGVTTDAFYNLTPKVRMFHETGVSLYHPHAVVRLELKVDDGCYCAEPLNELKNRLDTLEPLVCEKAPAITCQASGDVITLSDSAELPLRDLKVYGKTTQASTPSPENPQALESPTDAVVKTCGKNLIPFPYMAANKTDKGITFTVQDDGGIKVIGTSTADAFFNLCKHHFSDSILYASNTSRNTDGKVVISGAKGAVEIVYEVGADLVYLYIRTGSTVDTVVYPQIEYGTTPTEYEPYTGQSLALPILNEVGLAGVPIASGGNYTDANGQQWVCDEVDLKRGVYVRRIGSLDLGALTYGQSATSVEGQYRFAASPLRNEILTTVKVAPNDMKVAALSTGFVVSTASALYSGSYGIAVGKDGDVYIRGKQLNDLTTDEVKAAVSGFMFYYELAEPVEIPLDEATLSAFSSLHTNKPNTTITNNSGAWMSAEYVADTKLYIDNKFAELAAAIVSNS